jgi:hypothetical protein
LRWSLYSPEQEIAEGCPGVSIVTCASCGPRVGVSLNVVAEHLPAMWWRIPVLLSAAHDGLLEEVLVVGYLLRRLDQLGQPRLGNVWSV